MRILKWSACKNEVGSFPLHSSKVFNPNLILTPTTTISTESLSHTHLSPLSLSHGIEQTGQRRRAEVGMGQRRAPAAESGASRGGRRPRHPHLSGCPLRGGDPDDDDDASGGSWGDPDDDDEWAATRALSRSDPAAMDLILPGSGGGACPPIRGERRAEPGARRCGRVGAGR